MANFDFSIRPNKSIERKLMLECFLSLAARFPISKYKYIGFGSFWFTDFLLFHKRLGIKSMVSIERPKYAERASYNSPLKCISVEPGESTLVLPELQFDTNSLLWMDYDKGLNGPWREDADIVLPQLTPGGIYSVTVNAHKGQIVNQQDCDGQPLSQIAALKEFIGDLVPAGTKESDLTKSNFPVIVAEVLISHFRRVVRKANPRNQFEPLFNFSYSDNAAMVTVGGIVVDEDAREHLENCNWKSFDFLTGEIQCRIEAPTLTLKEKRALDRLLPKSVPLRENEVPVKLREGLKTSEVLGYQRFYRYYPIFAELQE